MAKKRPRTKLLSVVRPGSASRREISVSRATMVRDVLSDAGVSADDHWLFQGYEILSPDDPVWPLVELGGFVIAPATYF